MIKIVKNASVCDPTLLGDSVVTDKSSVLFLVPRLLIEGQRSKNKQIFENCKQTRARTSARFQKINKIKGFTKAMDIWVNPRENLLFHHFSFWNFISSCSQLTFGSNVFGDFKKLWNWGQLLTSNSGFFGQFSAET